MILKASNTRFIVWVRRYFRCSVIKTIHPWSCSSQIAGNVVLLRNGLSLTPKTFMSVIYGSWSCYEESGSIPSLAQGEFTTDSDQQESFKQIKPLRLKLRSKPTVNVSIGGQGVTVTKATLKRAVTKDLPIKDGKVELKKHYLTVSILDYEAAGTWSHSWQLTVKKLVIRQRN